MYIRDITVFISIPIEFADKWRYWQRVQLDLLYTIDHSWIILHAELSSWCLERVSMCSSWQHSAVFPPSDNFFWSDIRVSHSTRSRNSIISEWFSFLVREFSNERARVERRTAYRKAKSKRLFTTAFSSYLKWITQAGLQLTDVVWH